LTGAAGIGKLALATIPALVLGALLHKTIKDYLFAPLPVAAALFVGGVIILLVDRGHRGESGISADQITSKQAFLIGCIQCLAMWPGMSRSGTVIIGAMLLGLHRRAATEFSFLAAVPVLAAAAAKDAKDAFPTFSSHDLYLLGIGLVTSFLTALLTVKVFTAMVSKMTLTPFGYYRIALAVLVVWITVTS
jgi:undecaprenyl-diphosphatase